ncbi:MAG: ABC transporter permease [Clostridia bacterium]|nr:ABC transporter permease [Clostridia bacterium]
MEKFKAFCKKAWACIKNGTGKACSAVKDFISEPPFHVVKRAQISTKKAMLIRLIAIVAALLLCSLLSAVLIGANPIKFITTLFDGAFGSTRRIWKLAKDTAVLLCISLAVTPAFRMRFWNIGAEGQTLMGALAAAAVAHYLGGKMPNGVLLLLMFVAAVIVGAVWGGIPAIFKAKWNTNETLFTLMMNYIASGIVAYFLLLWTPSGSSVLGELPHGHMPSIINDYFPLIVAVLILTVLLFVYLRYAKHGYEISVVGESENTAKYVGINVGKVIVRTMLISGAICGIAGFLIVSALDHSVSETTVGGLGFTAIMASWLAKFNPLIMIGSSLFIVFLNQGANQITTTFNIASAFPDMVVGIILFFIIGCEFFINYSLKRTEKTKKEDA